MLVKFDPTWPAERRAAYHEAKTREIMRERDADQAIGPFGNILFQFVSGYFSYRRLGPRVPRLDALAWAWEMAGCQ